MDICASHRDHSAVRYCPNTRSTDDDSGFVLVAFASVQWLVSVERSSLTQHFVWLGIVAWHGVLLLWYNNCSLSLHPTVYSCLLKLSRMCVREPSIVLGCFSPLNVLTDNGEVFVPCCKYCLVWCRSWISYLVDVLWQHAFGIVT